MDELDGLYHEVILDHYHRPRNLQPVVDAELKARVSNLFCGDEVILQVKLDSDGLIQAAGHQGRGCAISQASASMLTEVIKGKALEEVQKLGDRFRRMMYGEPLSSEEREILAGLETLEGVRQFPIRIKCALLAWDALEEGLKTYQRQCKGTR